MVRLFYWTTLLVMRSGVEVQRMAGGGVVRGRVLKLMSNHSGHILDGTWTDGASVVSRSIRTPGGGAELLVPVSAPSSDSSLPPDGGAVEPGSGGKGTSPGQRASWLAVRYSSALL